MKGENHKASYSSLSLDQRAKIAGERIKDPESSLTAFSEKHNISITALKKIEEKIAFNKEAAAWEILKRVLEKDLELVNLSTNLKYRWAEDIERKKKIDNKDIEVLDKIENTALKRAALINSKAEEDEDNKVNVTINL